MLKKNDIIKLKIDDVTSEGYGVGRAEDGMAVFVPMTAPGDLAEVLLLKVGKSLAFGKATKLLAPSPARCAGGADAGSGIAPYDCAAFGRCGGCALRHISYDEEKKIKASWVRENFRRIGGFPLEDDAVDIFTTNSPDRYRNKALYPAGTTPDGKLHFGLYASRSHRVVACKDCLLEPEFYGNIVEAAAKYCNEAGLTAYEDGTRPGGIVRHLYIRDARATGEVSVSLIVFGDKIPSPDRFADAVCEACPGVVSVSLIVNKKPGNEILGDKVILLRGKDTITDELCGLRFEISPLSFYQVNRDGAELLYTLAANGSKLTPDSVLFDLYCGAGTIGLSFAKLCGAKSLYGVEIIPAAVENAKKNAASNGFENATFFCGDAGEAAVRLAGEGVRPDIVVVDPPRKGCGPDVFRAVEQMMPARITMISCNSATGARDARLFADLGYSIDRIFAVDMFPRTAHVETVVFLSRA